MALTKVGKEGVVGLDNSADATAITITSAENVGFGTASPTALSNYTSVVANNSTGSMFELMVGGTRTANMQTSASAMNIQTRTSIPMIFDTNSTEAMKIDANGHITKPLQPSFLVNPSSNQTDLAIGASTNVTIVYGNERYDVGSNFASNTFTAPVTGRYMLFSQIFLLNVDKAQTYIQHFLKTSNVTYSNVVSNNQMFAADIDYMTLNQSVVTDMDANDTAFIQINMYGGTQQMDVRTDSYFGGMLIG